MEVIKEDFEGLEGIEKLIAEDDVEGLLREEEKDDVFYTTYMTEIAAYHGSNKALQHILSKNVKPSTLINLYSIMRDNQLIISVPHQDELLAAVKYNCMHRLSSIKTPPISIALKAMIYAIEIAAWSRATRVYKLYTTKEWTTILRGDPLVTIVCFGPKTLPYLDGVKLKEEELLEVLDREPNVELLTSILPSELTVELGRLPRWRIEELGEVMTLRITSPTAEEDLDENTMDVVTEEVY